MGSRSRVLLFFACLATAVASIVAPGQHAHRAELAGVAVLAALLLVRPHREQPASNDENVESGAEQEAFPAPAPTRRRFQTRAGHAREVAFAAIQRTLADQDRQLAALAANERLGDLERRLADLETRADAQQQALQESHHQHTDQLGRLRQSITRHAEALHQLEHTLDPLPTPPEAKLSSLDLTSTR